MDTKDSQNDRDSLTMPTKKLVITSKIGAMGFVTYFVGVDGVSYPLDTALAYALVRSGHARLLTTEQAFDELF